MRIGFLDSGIGGLTVLKEALKLLPCEDYIYYADSLNAPYGTKSKEQVSAIVTKAVNFLSSKGIKALVVACNTATSIAIEDLRKNFPFPVIGMEPAVKPAVERNTDNHRRVLVVATPLTLKEEKFHNLVDRVDKKNIVDYLPLPGLVNYAEQLNFRSNEVIEYLERELSSVRLENYGTLVLGCTHFPFYKKVFSSILPSDIEIIDGNASTVRHLKNVLEMNNLLACTGTGNIDFYVSGEMVKDKKELGRFNALLELD